MNGAAAHLIKKGDEIIIMGFELADKRLRRSRLSWGRTMSLCAGWRPRLRYPPDRNDGAGLGLAGVFTVSAF